MDIESELDTFVEGVYAKLDDHLDLELLCLCGNKITVASIRNKKCGECCAPIKITIGDKDHG